MSWFKDIIDFAPEAMDIADPFIETPDEKREQQRVMEEYRTKQRLASSEVKQTQLETQKTMTMVMGLGAVAVIGLIIFTAT